MNECWAVDLGQIGYERAWDLQKRIVAARKLALIPDVLLLCEHPHVITMGRNGRAEHLLASEQMLRERGVEFHATNRGGDITYHGPGQLVAYPILNLAEIRRDVGWYVRQLEEALIRTTAEYGISAERRGGRTGIWVNRYRMQINSRQKKNSAQLACTSADGSRPTDWRITSQPI